MAEPEWSSVLMEAEKHLMTAGKMRLLLWRTSLTAAVTTPGFLDANAGELSSMALRTLPVYSDADSRRGVARLLRLALANDTFLKTFAGALVRKEAGVVGRHEAAVMLRWTCLVLSRLELPGAKKAVDRLAKVAATCLDGILGSGARRWRLLTSHLARLLAAKPGLFDACLAVAKAGGQPGMARALLDFAAGKPDVMEGARADLLAMYCDRVLGVKGPPRPGDSGAYRGLLQTLSHEEFKSTVLPTATRCMRRNPEGAVPAVAALLADVGLDMSRHAGELMDVVMQFLRHTKEAVRRGAVEVARALARGASDVDAVEGMMRALREVLEGRAEGGKVKNTAERGALVAAVAALCAAPGKGKGVAFLAEETVDFVCRYYEGEVNEEVKLCTLEALGLWLCRCMSFPDVATARIAKGLTESKETLRKANLNALVVALKNMDLRHQGGSLVPPLCKLICTGLNKTAQRAEGITAFLAAALIASADVKADSVLQTDSVWQSCLAPEAPFWSGDTVSRLSSEEACLLADLVHVLLTIQVAKVDENHGAVDALCKVLILLTLHSSKSVRQSAGTSITRCLGMTPALLAFFLVGLRCLLKDVKQVPIFQGPDTEETGYVSRMLVSRRFSDAILHLVPFGLDTCPTDLAQLLLAAHHPAITNVQSMPGATWRQLVTQHSDIPKILAGGVDYVIPVLSGPNGLGSTDDRDVDAAILAVTSAMGDCPETLFDPILSIAREKLDRTVHDKLSPKDLRIFSTPDGVLSSELGEFSLGAIDAVDKKSKPKTKKPRGRFKTGKNPFGGDSSSDDETQASSTVVRPSQLAGGRAGSAGKGGAKAKDAKDREAEVRQAKLAEEAQIRLDLAAIQSRLGLGLRIISALVDGNRQVVSERLEELVLLVMPLITSPLVGEGPAFSTTVSLARCLPGPLVGLAIHVAICLRLAHLAEARKGLEVGEVLEHPSMRQVVDALLDVTSDKLPLPGPSYFLVFPILRFILGAPSYSTLHEPALKVLSLHVTPGEKLPREGTFALLYHLLSTIPAYRDSVQPLLLSLCAGVIDTELLAALQGLLAENSLVRSVALTALPMVPCLSAGLCPEDEEMLAVLMIGCNDPNATNQEAAQDLWKMAGCTIPESFASALMKYLGHPHSDIRKATTQALVCGLEQFREKSVEVLNLVLDIYEADSPTELREGCAMALEACAKYFDAAQVQQCLDFLLTHGLPDDNASVRDRMVAAGVELVDVHGTSQVQVLYPLLQSHLEGTQRASPEEAIRSDRVREGVVLLLGTMARHLMPEDPKVRGIVGKLMDVLVTPSESVQRAASGCLSPLLAMFQSDRAYVEGIVKKLKEQLAHGTTYGDRRGAAYGLAGVVKGLGITTLKNFAIMDSLKAYVEDKSDANAREGGILAFECFCDRLGKLFEPYVIHVLPLLLTCFGDSALQVRQATVDAARAIMRNLSGQGVKLVLPSLLKGLEDKQWRTKQGSIQLLGAMAWCAPKQLSTALPTIVPRLSDVLADPHAKVQAAAQQALNEVGSVIRNPEILVLVPALLKAIGQPNQHTKDCLDVLLGTMFVNTIDAASLALIVPVVHRGLRDRSGETKKKAARILQNLCRLINDPKDMTPYVQLMIPEIQKAILDPLPDVRGQASKALGALFQDLGAQAPADVMPWLMETLRSKGSSVERSGAAQALSEVLAIHGKEHLEGLMPEILSDCSASNATNREGGLMLFRFLPQTMQEDFQAHLSTVLPFILDGLADENDDVREAAMAAGRMLVNVYAESALPLLLPEVERGLFNENWRIRQSSVDLLGSLFYKVAGTSGKVVVDGGSDDEGVAVESYGAAIIRAVGMQRRNEVLAKLYVCRSDVQYPVRTQALHVWKTVVVNTPKTLGEMLPALMDLLIDTLANGGEDGRQTSGRCLGELVRKMGERVLPIIVPILKTGTESSDVATRQGVCFGLKEVLDGLTRHQLTEHLTTLLPAIQAALCDTDATVREAAAEAFNALFKAGAGPVVDSVVPALLSKLEVDSHNSQALEGLQVILSVRPQMLTTMVPRLLKKPYTSTNLGALGALSEAAGASLQSHISTIMTPVLTVASRQDETPVVDAARECASRVALSVQDEAAYKLMADIQKGLEDPSMRLWSAKLVETVCTKSRLDIQDYVPDLIQNLVPLLAEEDHEVLMACWTALGAVTKTIPKEMMPSYVRSLKDAIATAKEKERRRRRGMATAGAGPILVAGFCLPKALTPVLPIYLQGVLQGNSAEFRELAAEGLGELIEVTDEKVLKAFVVQITGPLIRIISDRFPWQIKFAILSTMGLLISKGRDGLKAFVPQLQTTFLKCLQDPTPAVRDQAAKNLGNLAQLMNPNSKVDALMKDLSENARKAEAAVGIGFLSALRGALILNGNRVSGDVLIIVRNTVEGMLGAAGEDESFLIAVATCLGVLCMHCSAEEFKSILGKALGPSPSAWTQRYAHAVLVATVARYASGRLQELDIAEEFISCITKFSRDDKIPIKVAAGRAASHLVVSEIESAGTSSSLPALVTTLTTVLCPDQSSEVQRRGMAALRVISQADVEALQPHYGDVVPPLCALVQTSTGPMKVVCERTLSAVLGLRDGMDAAQAYLGKQPGALVKSVLTEAYMRRLQKLPLDDIEDEDEY